jgi:hypothetical protein
MPSAGEEGMEAAMKLFSGSDAWPSSGAGTVCRGIAARHCGGGSEASIRRRVRAGLTVPDFFA